MLGPFPPEAEAEAEAESLRRAGGMQIPNDGGDKGAGIKGAAEAHLISARRRGKKSGDKGEKFMTGECPLTFRTSQLVWERQKFLSPFDAFAEKGSEFKKTSKKGFLPRRKGVNSFPSSPPRAIVEETALSLRPET